MGIFFTRKIKGFNVFKYFKAHVENETEKTIKSLRKDRGGEYFSKAFEEFCKYCGIPKKKAHNIIYTSTNGVLERKDITILDMAQSLLAQGRVPKAF